ncbi:MAG: hypothetical protein KC729_12315 [Candidatus Eisenbacteria bacterium]|uniref:Uncharacterized protein n=1 Tax=Eiseniibacteriota bacterium TaxID=2212470 RepID=A0A956M0C7_UNCEI|nr:hypothetical protein [Candidatus Eisenbacteria bacterium]
MGYDRFDYSEYLVGDYPGLPAARAVARERSSTPNAVPPTRSDLFTIYDDGGCLVETWTFGDPPTDPAGADGRRDDS